MSVSFQGNTGYALCRSVLRFKEAEKDNQLSPIDLQNRNHAFASMGASLDITQADSFKPAKQEKETVITGLSPETIKQGRIGEELLKAAELFHEKLRERKIDAEDKKFLGKAINDLDTTPDSILYDPQFPRTIKRQAPKIDLAEPTSDDNQPKPLIGIIPNAFLKFLAIGSLISSIGLFLPEKTPEPLPNPTYPTEIPSQGQITDNIENSFPLMQDESSEREFYKIANEIPYDYKDGLFGVKAGAALHNAADESCRVYMEENNIDLPPNTWIKGDPSSHIDGNEGTQPLRNPTAQVRDKTTDCYVYTLQ